MAADKKSPQYKIKHIPVITRSEDRFNTTLHPNLGVPSGPKLFKSTTSLKQRGSTHTAKKTIPTADKLRKTKESNTLSLDTRKARSPQANRQSLRKASNHNQTSQPVTKTKNSVGKQSIQPRQTLTGQNIYRLKRKPIIPPTPIPPPTGIRKIFYSRCVLVIVNFVALVVALVSIFGLSVMYIVIPRSFFGPAESIYVAAFIVIPLCGLGISYLCVTSFTISSWKSRYHEIGYIFNGNIFEALVYFFILVFFSWIAVAPSEDTIRMDMKEAIAKNNIEPWHKTQDYFKCCGIDGYEDFRNFTNKEGRRFPLSCCLNHSDCSRNITVVQENQVWKPGCIESVLFVSTALNFSAVAVFFVALLITTLGVFSVKEAFRHKAHPKHILLFNDPNWMLPMSPQICASKEPHPNLIKRPRAGTRLV